jgi:threonyl-tRNA synthetase
MDKKINQPLILTHQELGNKLKLFFFDDVSPGSCFFLPHGTEILNKLIDMIRWYYRKYGYSEVNTPVMCDKRLWMKSGHYDKYKENMFWIEKDPQDQLNNESIEFSLCPMNCPKHTKIFEHMNPSYRDLPIRLADFGALHRNELSGALHGLTRCRLFHQDDAHVFATEDQVENEIDMVLKMLSEIYALFELKYELAVSTRPDKYIGDLAVWDKAENILKKCVSSHVSDFKIKEGDGAFYGPKIDVMVLDSQDRKHQLATIQLDFNLPERFDLKYKTNSEEKPYERPIMIHRAIFGSLERFIAIMLENNQGHLPFWLSPRKCVILPVSEKQLDYAHDLKLFLTEKLNIRIDVEFDNTLPKRILESEIMHYNYILVVGKKEVANNTVNVRKYSSGVIGEMSSNELANMMTKELIF